MNKASNGMMGNKWLQAALISGVGIGIFFGPIIFALLGIGQLLVGMMIMFWGMWKLGNIRGTDGFGGPYYGPKQSAERAEQLKKV